VNETIFHSQNGSLVDQPLSCCNVAIEPWAGYPALGNCGTIAMLFLRCSTAAPSGDQPANLQVYTLVAGKNGSKMQEAKEGRRGRIDYTGPGKIVFTECGLAGLTNALSNMLESPVLDNTGLKGFYNFSLEYADPRWAVRSKDGHPLPLELTSRPDIFTAVQEQLGLKLEAKKGPVEILVVDHIERPSEN
jgi:uncharacterized protein (TIGR03435 family)